MDKLLKAIEIAGGQAKLARLIGVSPQDVWNWLNRDLRVPPGHCPSIERETGILCEELNPQPDWGVLRKSKRRNLRAPRPTAPTPPSGCVSQHPATQDTLDNVPEHAAAVLDTPNSESLP